MLIRKLLLLTILCLNLFAKDKITLYPDWLNQFQFAGYYIAKEKGFYDNFDLDVDIKPFNQNINIVDEVLKNSATFGIGKSSLILEKYNQKDIIFLSSILQESPLILLSLRDQNINEIKDLKNKNIMITDDAIDSATIKSILSSEKSFDISSIGILPHSGNLNDLIDGKVDVYAGYLSNEPYILSKKNINFNYFSTNYLNFNFYEGIIFTSKTEALSNPNRVKSFNKASLQGWEYAFTHVEESAKIIFEKYNTQNKSLDELIYEGNVLKELSRFDQGILGNIDANRIEDIKKFYTYSGINKSAYSFNSKSIIFDMGDLVLDSFYKNYLENNSFALLLKSKNEPFSYKSQGEFKGFEIDFWNLLSTKLSKQFSTEEILSSKNSYIFTDSIKTSFVYSFAPPKKLDKIYTKPIAQIPLALTTKDNKSLIYNLSSLDSAKIAILDSFNIKGKLLSLYPNINFVEFKSHEELLKAINSDDYFGFIDTIYSLNALIGKNSHKNLRLNSSLNINLNLYLELDAKNSEFKNILDIAISTLKPEEISSILNSHSQIFINEETDYKQVLKIIIPLLIIIALILYFNYKLSKEIKLRKITQNKLVELATNDTLTNIFNRRKLEEICEHEIKISARYKTPFSIIFFDLNDFKPINDTFGHHAGDEVLIKISDVIKNQIRTSDSFGRWGGDEFLIALPQTNISQANSLINILQTSLMSIEFDFDKDLKITCSFGAYEHRSGNTLDFMLKKADEIMYAVKMEYKSNKKA